MLLDYLKKIETALSIHTTTPPDLSEILRKINKLKSKSDQTDCILAKYRDVLGLDSRGGILDAISRNKTELSSTKSTIANIAQALELKSLTPNPVSVFDILGEIFRLQAMTQREATQLASIRKELGIYDAEESPGTATDIIDNITSRAENEAMRESSGNGQLFNIAAALGVFINGQKSFSIFDILNAIRRSRSTKMDLVEDLNSANLEIKALNKEMNRLKVERNKLADTISHKPHSPREDT